MGCHALRCPPTPSTPAIPTRWHAFPKTMPSAVRYCSAIRCAALLPLHYGPIRSYALRYDALLCHPLLPFHFRALHPSPLHGGAVLYPPSISCHCYSCLSAPLLSARRCACRSAPANAIPCGGELLPVRFTTIRSTPAFPLRCRAMPCTHRQYPALHCFTLLCHALLPVLAAAVHSTPALCSALRCYSAASRKALATGHS